MRTRTITGPTALASAFLLAGCYTTTTSRRELQPAPALEGQIVAIREIVQHTQGDPVAGAVAGGVIGGLLGQAFTGQGAAALFGAVGGAATGAAASRGASERRTYEVEVRFDDGTRGRIVYATPPPWHTGDRVRQSPRGLEWVGRPASTPPPAYVPPMPTTPPTAEPPPPPAQQTPPPEQPTPESAPPA